MDREPDDDEWPEIERKAIVEIRPYVLWWIASLRAVERLSFIASARVVSDSVRLCLVEARYAEGDLEEQKDA